MEQLTVFQFGMYGFYLVFALGVMGVVIRAGMWLRKRLQGEQPPPMAIPDDYDWFYRRIG